jgi:hypothetical protein
MNLECSNHSPAVSGIASTLSQRPEHSETRHSRSDGNQHSENTRSSGDVLEHAGDIQGDSASVCYQFRSQDSGLATVIEAWKKLSEADRAHIVAIVEESQRGQEGGTR